MDFLEEMPSLGRRDLMNLRKGIDAGFRSFSRSYGEDLENFFDPLLQFLIFFEKLLISTPWPIILLIVAGLTWLGSRSWKIVVGSVLCFMLIGYLDMWEDTMSTVAMISVATLICISIGIPIGVLMSRSDRLQATITPVLDVMQTIPSFVYLIPVVMLLGIGKVPGLLAVCIYALPPIVRLTNLGIRRADSIGFTQYFRWGEPDDHDGSGNGGDCFDDRRQGFGYPCLAGDFQPIFGAWAFQWTSDCCPGNHL